MDSARWVRVEHEHFIPLAPSALCDVLRAELQGTKAEKDVKRFTTIVQLLEMLIRMQYYPLTETLKRSYDIFDPARAAHSTVQLSPDEIKAREGTAQAAGLPARGTSRDALSLTRVPHRGVPGVVPDRDAARQLYVAVGTRCAQD